MDNPLNLDTTQSDEDRARMQQLLSLLQNQAATGDGSWQGQLAAATQQAQSGAQALAQSAPGLSRMDATRAAGEGASAAGQRAIGQGNILRARQQQLAQSELASILGAQSGTDAEQAAQHAAAMQSQGELAQADKEQQNKETNATLSGVAQGIGVLASLSHGGPVPGQPETFGDDEANDTVPAWLSPGEIVLPRSVTHSADAPDAAAAFVRAVKSHHGQQHFDAGGVVPDASPIGANDSAADIERKLAGLGRGARTEKLTGGGVLDTDQYNATRSAQLANAQNFMGQYLGTGPSVAPQQMQNSADATVGDAMQAAASARGSGRAAGLANVVGATGEQLSGDAGRSAETTAGEANAGAQAFANAVQRQRQNDLALANAQQAAQMRSHMLARGIGLAEQAQMRNILGGVGQGLASGASMFSRNSGGGGYDSWGQDSAPSSYGDYSSGDYGSGGGDSGGGFDVPTGDSGTAYAAHGGEIRGYAEGGDVDPRFAAAEATLPPTGAGEDALVGQVMAGERQPAPASKTLWDPAWTSPTPSPGPSSSPSGIVSQMAPASVPARAPAAPMPQAARPAMPPPPDNFALQQQAIQEEGRINEQKGAEQAQALIGAQKELQRAAIAQREQHARAREAAESDFARVQRARDEMASINMTVDPGRWWASRSTPGKIFAAIGLALGAVGAGNDGVNRAAGIIENAVGRDLEAQKAEHELRMKKGQLSVDSSTSLYTLHRQLAQDDISATEAAKGTALQLAQNQIELAGAKASSPLAKQQALALSAQVGIDRTKLDEAAKQRGLDNYIKREDMESRRLTALKEAGANRAEKGFVSPGYELMPGAAPKVEELAKWRDGLTEKKNTDAAIGELKKLIDRSSLLPGTKEAARAESLISDLKVGYKNMATLGALSGSDYKLIDSAIPDPTSLRGHLTSDKSLKARLDQFGQTADTKFHNRAQVLGIVKSGEAPAGAATGQRIARNPKTGERRYVNPDGSLGEAVR